MSLLSSCTIALFSNLSSCVSVLQAEKPIINFDINRCIQECKEDSQCRSLCALYNQFFTEEQSKASICLQQCPNLTCSKKCLLELQLNNVNIQKHLNASCQYKVKLDTNCLKNKLGISFFKNEQFEKCLSDICQKDTSDKSKECQWSCFIKTSSESIDNPLKPSNIERNSTEKDIQNSITLEKRSFKFFNNLKIRTSHFGPHLKKESSNSRSSGGGSKGSSGGSSGGSKGSGSNSAPPAFKPSSARSAPPAFTASTARSAPSAFTSSTARSAPPTFGDSSPSSRNQFSSPSTFRGSSSGSGIQGYHYIPGYYYPYYFPYGSSYHRSSFNPSQCKLVDIPTGLNLTSNSIDDKTFANLTTNSTSNQTDPKKLANATKFYSCSNGKLSLAFYSSAYGCSVIGLICFLLINYIV